MALLPKVRAAVALLAAACLACPPAHALVSLNDGTEHLYLTGTAGLSYDSNIYAHAGSVGDTIYSAGLLLEYSRRAGMIGVDGQVGLDLSQFVDNHGENYINPRFGLEFTKATGRTTGDLNLRVARENRADSAVNLRTESWNYSAALQLKYPVIERYSIAGNIGYTSRQYNRNTGLSNLETYNAGADLYYTLASDRDLVAGYRYRYSETSRNTAFDDNAFTVGVSGKIVSRLNGSLRVGYQARQPHGATTDGDFHGLTASGAVTWTATKKFSLTGELVKDLSVTASDVSIDTLSANLDAQYVFNAKVAVFVNVGGGNSRFLGVAAAGRHDRFFTFGGGVNYTLMQHLRATLAYTHYQNWSTLAYSDYDRNTFTLSLSSRW